MEDVIAHHAVGHQVAKSGANGRCGAGGGHSVGFGGPTVLSRDHNGNVLLATLNDMKLLLPFTSLSLTT